MDIRSSGIWLMRSFACGLLTSLSLAAADVDNVAFHGAISTTAAYSDRYDYIGDTAKNININTAEVIVNGSHRFENGLRVSAQVYGFKLGDYSAMSLDFAALDYSFNESIGVRVGRVKHAFGLYGESQDLDMVRPFAFLPLDFYSKLLRPLDASFDGASVYGNLRLGKGSIEYQVYGGWAPEVDPKNPFFVGLSEAAPLTTTSINTLLIYGANAIWNTPAEGLRFGASAWFIPKATFAGPMRRASSLALATSDARLLPNFFPPGAWDAVVAGKPASLENSVANYYLSAEYTRGDWQFAAEVSYLDSNETTALPVLGTSDSESKSDSSYVMITYQASKKLQLGTYYGLAHANSDDRDGSKLVSVPSHIDWLKDFAVASSYNLAPWWLLKAEVHLLNGTKGLGAKGNGDAATWKADWTYITVKTTISF